MVGKRSALAASLMLLAVLLIGIYPAHGQDGGKAEKLFSIDMKDKPAGSAGQVVRVGLNSGVGKPHDLTLLCRSSFDITSTAGERLLTVAEGQQARFTAGDDRLKVAVSDVPSGTFKGPLRLVPRDGASFEVIAPKIKQARYRHILEIAGGSKLTVVNELPLEDYVRSVVPAEVPRSFHPEAQKALTVAIRTYAVKSLGRHKAEGYNLCDGIHCQGFSGGGMESPWADELAEETRGQIAVYDGKPIYAVYSTDCGGATQSGEDAGFNKESWPYLRSVLDQPDAGTVRYGLGLQGRVACQLSEEGPPPTALEPQSDYCAASPHHVWSRSFTLDELSSKLGQSGKIGRLRSIEFEEYDSSGRVKTVALKGEAGECSIRGTRLRDMLGLDTVKSTRMALAVDPEGRYVIWGRGYGHGVGLCAFGANGLAKSRPGITYVGILKHYYTGIEIASLSD